MAIATILMWPRARPRQKPWRTMLRLVVNKVSQRIKSARLMRSWSSRNPPSVPFWVRASDGARHGRCARDVDAASAKRDPHRASRDARAGARGACRCALREQSNAPAWVGRSGPSAWSGGGTAGAVQRSSVPS